MIRLLVLLLLLNSWPVLAQEAEDTPDSRAALAKELGDIEAPNIRRAIADMMDRLEGSVPLDRRQRFRAEMEKLITYDTIRRYSDSVAARELTTEELAALVAFYRSPLGRSIMLKLPSVARDTELLIQSVVADALRQLSSQPLLLPGEPL